MSEIKKPVIYDTEGWYIKDADGNVVCDIDAEGLPSDEFHFIGNEIAIAINEHADLKAKLADANRGAQVNALVNESLAKKLKLAVEANRYALATFRALNSYTFEDSDHGLLIAEAVKKLEAFHDEGGEQR